VPSPLSESEPVPALLPFKRFLLLNPVLSNGGYFLEFYSRERILLDPTARSQVLQIMTMVCTVFQACSFSELLGTAAGLEAAAVAVRCVASRARANCAQRRTTKAEIEAHHV
jgi:hypothetical protein